MPPSNPPVLVTGATGYIAAELTGQLLRAGRTVRGTTRSLAKAEGVRAALPPGTPHRGLDFVVADLERPRDWVAACEGVREVYHVASPFFVARPDHEDELIVPAREGTLNVLRAATAAGVRRVVLTSSVAAVVYPDPDPAGARLYDERDWTDQRDRARTSPYTRSKTIAEETAWRYVAETPDAPELVTVCPGVVFGPLNPASRSDSSLALTKLVDGEVPAVPDIGFEVVDVRDVADLHVRVMTAPEAAGRRFLCTAGYRSYREIALAARDVVPGRATRRVPTRTLPDAGVRVLALVDAEARGILNELGKHSACSNAAARALGWRPRSPEEAIYATVRDYVAQRAVAPPSTSHP